MLNLTFVSIALCWFILIDYILVDKNASISKTSISRTFMSGASIIGTPYF
jgi:hypothetical protein